jgi:hypothetical protein
MPINETQVRFSEASKQEYVHNWRVYVDQFEAGLGPRAWLVDVTPIKA